LADLPWAEHAVAVQLRVRKIFCDNAKCKRRIFTERLPSLAAPWARKTARLSDRLTAVGIALGGTAGARLGRSMGLATSRNTLLRLVRRAPIPPNATQGRSAWTTGRCASDDAGLEQRAADDVVLASPQQALFGYLDRPPRYARSWPQT